MQQATNRFILHSSFGTSTLYPCTLAIAQKILEDARANLPEEAIELAKLPRHASGGPFVVDMQAVARASELPTT
jgi:hypothetical protein